MLRLLRLTWPLPLLLSCSLNPRGELPGEAEGAEPSAGLDDDFFPDFGDEESVGETDAQFEEEERFEDSEAEATDEAEFIDDDPVFPPEPEPGAAMPDLTDVAGQFPEEADDEGEAADSDGTDAEETDIPDEPPNIGEADAGAPDTPIVEVDGGVVVGDAGAESDGGAEFDGGADLTPDAAAEDGGFLGESDVDSGL